MKRIARRASALFRTLKRLFIPSNFPSCSLCSLCLCGFPFSRRRGNCAAVQGTAVAMLIEVIAQSVADAVEAETGGADRLGLVRALEEGGLPPASRLVSAVPQA